MQHDNSANKEIAKLLRLCKPEAGEPDKIIGTLDGCTLEFRRGMAAWNAKVDVVVTLPSGARRNLYYNIMLVDTELCVAWDDAMTRAQQYEYETSNRTQRECQSLCRKWLAMEE